MLSLTVILRNSNIKHVSTCSQSPLKFYRHTHHFQRGTVRSNTLQIFAKKFHDSWHDFHFVCPPSLLFLKLTCITGQRATLVFPNFPLIRVADFFFVNVFSDIQDDLAFLCPGFWSAQLCKTCNCKLVQGIHWPGACLSAMHSTSY